MKLKDSERDLVFQFVVTTRCNLRCNNCSYGCTSKKANLVYNPDILKKDILYVVLGPLEREEYGNTLNNDFYCLKNIIQYGRYNIFTLE